jgi:hypothetical protein
MTDVVDNDTKQAAAFILSHAQGYKAVLTIAEKIDQLGKWDQIEAEAKGRLDASNQLLAQVVSDTEAKAKEFARLNASLDDVRAQAASIIADAKGEAKNIVAAAQADAQSAASAVAAAAEADLGALRKQTADAKDELGVINVDIAKARTTLSDLNAAAVEAQDREKKARDFIASLKG